MLTYKCLSINKFESNGFHIEPLRDIDKYDILEIRNQQLYHLRQSKPLTKEQQDNYFNKVVALLFDQEKPNQLLFSFFENNEFVGYGGLVHINWIDKIAEISFVMKTDLEKNNFSKYWSNYISLIEKIAFSELNFHKIFTYAFDLRPHLYAILEKNGFTEEARLEEHCLFDDNYIDVVYHSKINRKISYRKSNEEDLLLYFNWANDSSVRENSYQTKRIDFEDHQKWYLNKIKDPNCLMLIFENHLGFPIGQVRIQKNENKTALIGISNDKNHRGKGYASEMLKISTELFLSNNSSYLINAYINLENIASEKAFRKAGFELNKVVDYEGISSFHFIKQIK